MNSHFSKVSKVITTTIVLVVAITFDAPQAKGNSLIQKDLIFGRNIPGGGEVSEPEFQGFLDSEITPRFPDGLTIFDADGQFRDSTNTIIQEQSKLVTLLVEDTPRSETGINEIVMAYLQQFNQESVLQVTNSDEFHVGFGPGENLIDNDPIPEFIQADLFFGRNIAGGGEVSEPEFQGFLDSEITPRFPDGLTIFDADGQFRDSTNTIIQEQSKVVTLLFEDTQTNETALDNIMEFYIQQFNQESVLLTVNEAVTVGFGPGENLIDNNPIPEFIQADLFFGRNIAGGGEVSEQEFQGFLDSEITPRFPDGLTIFDADGQFQDSTNTIIQEPSKVVTLLFEDTQTNETALDNIVESYIEQFNQESVLLVIDEDQEVAFDAPPNVAIPEPSPILGLFVLGVLGARKVSGQKR
ncbi:DUF3574 domain-containing protein [Gloeocapsa sp. PCC 73106]|uniref:DUF3574 domain-containing protein n=1 Tax=Gloeocapsa sp. PCC 73106 TaxID=102232 RepID=UPI0002AC8B86|nr:DUF3574 domain-containing protein [Gloeocapsa sp. PCC 73106]ELR99987.1 Protein of unknown function (DUF3574) [Gloeocapsa sp. PCC 73106]